MEHFWDGFEKQASCKQASIVGRLVGKASGSASRATAAAGGAVKKIKSAVKETADKARLLAGATAGVTKSDAKGVVKKFKQSYHKGKAESLGLTSGQYTSRIMRKAKEAKKLKAEKLKAKELKAKSKAEAKAKKAKAKAEKAAPAVPVKTKAKVESGEIKPQSAKERIPVSKSEQMSGIEQKGMDEKYLTQAEKAKIKADTGKEPAGPTLKERTGQFFRKYKKPLAIGGGVTAATGVGVAATRNKDQRTRVPLKGYPM